MRSCWPLLAVCCLVVTGCASNLATLADPEVMPRGKVHVGVAVGAFIPSRPVINAIDVGVKGVQRAQSGALAAPMTTEEKRSLINAGLALALQPPSAGWEVQVRTGLFENVDVGVRYSVNQLRADARYRLFHSERWEEGEGPAPLGEDAGAGARLREAFRLDRRVRSYDATLQLGVSYYLFNNVLAQALDAVKLGDFSRWDFDAALTWGFDVRRIFKFYFGPKAIYTTFSLDENLYDLSNTVTDVVGAPKLSQNITNHMLFTGGVVGAAVGYKYLFLYTELTAGYTWARPVVLGEERDLGGLTLYPAIGLAAKFP